MPNVYFTGKCANNPDKSMKWQGNVDAQMPILDLLKSIYQENPEFVSGFYDLKINRLRPYHLILVNNKILRREELQHYRITEICKIKIIPFVSGG